MAKLKLCPYCKQKHRKQSAYNRCKQRHSPGKWPK